MTRTSTWPAIAALLVAALVAASGRAAEPGADPTPSDLRKVIADLKEAIKDLNDLKEGKIKNFQSRIINLETKIDTLEADLLDVQQKLAASKRTTALRPDTTGATAFKGQGRIRFINEFTEDMSVVVNGRSFRLVPGEERLVPVPPGDYSYQVLQLQRAAQLREIAADETKTVRIFPVR